MLLISDKDFLEHKVLVDRLAETYTLPINYRLERSNYSQAASSNTGFDSDSDW